MRQRTWQPPPPFLFRYRPPEEVTHGYFEGLLRDNHIWASPPRSFIDLDDCRAQIDFELSKEEMHRHWVRIFKTLGRKGLDASKAANNVIAKGAWKDPGSHKEILQKVQDTLNNSGVICLSDTALDRRTWEEYAGSHRGICLCFETSERPFSSAYDVNYMTELPTVKINADSGEMMEAFLLTKGSSYSWEREWRFVDYDKGSGYKPISPWALRAIVLGSQAEETLRQEVIRLVTRWKADVTLLAVDASGSDLRLQPLDRQQVLTRAHINPPIQEHIRREPVPRPLPVRLLDYLRSVPPEYRRQDLDSRIEGLAGRLNSLLSKDMRSRDAVANATLSLQEAADLVREIVDRSGKAIPGYGEVAVLLYGFVHEFAIKTEIAF